MSESVIQHEQDNALLARLDRLPFLPFHLRLSVLLGTGLLFAGLDVVAVAILLPTLIAVFHLGLTTAGTLIGAVYLGQIIGSLFFGIASRWVGRKWLFLISVVVFGLFSLLTAFTMSFGSLFVLRFLVGLPLGGLIPLATAFFTEYAPASVRGRSTAGVLFLYSAGFVLAPFLLALLLQPLFGLLAWRVLLGCAGLSLLLVPFALRGLPESVRWLLQQGRVKEAEKYVALLEREAVARDVPVSKSQQSALPASTSSESRKNIGRPAPWSKLFSTGYRGLTLLVWVRWLVGACILVGFASWLPTLYTLIGVSMFQIQLLNIVFGLVTLLVLLGYMLSVDRVGRKRFFLIGFGLAIVGAVVGGIFFTLLRSTSWWVLLLTGLCLSMGGYLVVVNNFISTAELYPTSMRVVALSTSKCLDAVASIVVPVMIPTLVTTGFGIGGVFLFLGLLSFIALLTEIFLGKESKLLPLEMIAPEPL